MIIIGIDPGLTGALAMLGPRGDEFRAIRDLPVMVRGGSGAFVKNQINAAELEAMLRHFLEGFDKNEVHFFIETPIAFPGQHVASTAAAFLTSGLIEGVVLARHYKHTLVAPSVWKKAMQLGKNKQEARTRAIRLFPAAAGELSRMKDHNRAEALLIAKYGHGQVA